LKRLFSYRPLVLGIVLAIILICLVFTAGRALDYMEIVDTYWGIHDDVLLPTEAGRYYIDLFWYHNPELCNLVLSSPEVKDDGLVILLQFEPGLRALVNGEGDEVRITQVMVDRVQAYLDLLMEVGSPELQDAIRIERARTPFGEFSGMTFEQARILLVGLPQEPTATPFSTTLP
jgi:hypothetical protein